MFLCLAYYSVLRPKPMSELPAPGSCRGAVAGQQQEEGEHSAAEQLLPAPIKYFDIWGKYFKASISTLAWSPPILNSCEYYGSRY